jgi:hypothetical protein
MARRVPALVEVRSLAAEEKCMARSSATRNHDISGREEVCVTF